MTLVGALAGAVMAASIVAMQQAPPETSPQQDPAAIQVDDVLVEGRRLEALVSEFVAETAAPARGRGLARWHDSVCVGVVNLRQEAAQYIADAVSSLALELGLTPGEPGCRANIVVVFAEDGRALAEQLATEHRRAFRSGTAGIDRGNVAFADFVRSDRPVRWWHLSMPVNAETGRRAIRLPGDEVNGMPAAPMIAVFAASRLNSQIRDDMRKAMVIVDIDAIETADLAQLADYIAVVSLAQIDPGAEVGDHDTILKLFDRPDSAPPGLTEWDRSYLRNLYRVLDSPQLRSNPAAVSTTVASAMTRERRAAGDEERDED